MTIDARFRAGGLASGLDSNAIIDQLVSLEKRPIDLLAARQDALKVQVSLLGDLASRLSALQKAAKSLKRDGVLRLSTGSTPTNFSVTPTTGGTAGRFSVEVQALAQAAKARSAAFTPGVDVVRGGTLDLTVMGQTTSVTLTDGMTLSEVASAVNASGAAVSATVLSDGTREYLSLTNRDTGYPLSGAPGDALSITETSTGSLGQPLGLTLTQAAANATVVVDGLSVSRMSNELSDVLPGVKLSLKSTGAVEDVVLGYDTEATRKNLEAFVTAYNDVLSAVQRQLNVAPGADRSKTLAGDSVVRSVQSALQKVVAATVPGLGTVRALADLGVQTSRDGSLSIDEVKLSAAITRESTSVDALFTTASTGLSDVVDDLVDQYTAPSSGLITARKDGLNQSIKRMDATLEQMNARLDGYRRNLIAQFTAMETVVSGFKSIGNYLTNNPFPKIGGSDS
ncbi:MAG: flagellar filament capping protein FliD [Myxococcota bacterium]